MQTKFYFTRTIGLVALLLFANFVLAQIERIDSLRKVLPNTKDTGRVNTLNELAKAYRQIRTDSTIIVATQAYNEGVKLNYKTGMARATLITMFAYLDMGNQNKYEEYARKTIPLYKELKDYQYLLHSYRRIGEVLAEKCRYKEAIEFYEKGIELAPKTGQYKNWNITYLNIAIGDALRESGNFEKAYEYYQKGLTHSSTLKSSHEIGAAMAYAYEAMGNLYLQFDDLENAKYYFDRTPQRIYDDEWNATRYKAKLSLERKDYDSALFYYNTYYENTMKELKKEVPDSLAWKKIDYDNNRLFGNLYVELKNYDKAIGHLLPAIRFSTENGHTSESLTLLQNITRAYIGKNDLSKALQNANQLMKVAEEVKVKLHMRDGYQLLSDIYEKSGDKDKANLYFRKYVELKDELKTDQFKQKLKLYKAEEEEKRKTGAIKQLKKEKQWLSIGIILLATTVASFLAFIWVQRKSIARKKLLQKQDLALKEAENEKRIAGLEMLALRSQMNPHFIFNCLNSINRFVLRNDTEAASGYLTKFSKLMRMVLENSKQPLIPLEEEVKCLELYIQMEQFRCKNAFTYYIKYHDGVNTEEAMIPPLLLQPFVENAIWHGVNPKEGDGKIGIEFFQKEEALYCVIRDNGIGRKKASELRSQLSEHHKSMGLQITKERLAIIEEQQSKESPVEIEDMYDENGKAVGTKVTIRVFSLPAFEELKSSLNL